MPAHDTSAHHEEERDRDGERSGERHDKGDRADKGSKQKQPAATKAKDLSHVPCKFFKVGGCTAGSSCPFSHAVQEPGAQKETCAWFVKGNCKFGHKCALAHVLPGQPMSMDRKNKKAAQQAAQQAAAAAAQGGGSGAGSGSGPGGAVGAGDKAAKRGRKDYDKVAGAGPRNALLGGGSTAPTRMLNPGGRLPINAISPSAPAPPVKDIDFASLEGLDETDRLASAPAQGKKHMHIHDSSPNRSSPMSENQKLGGDEDAVVATNNGKNGTPTTSDARSPNRGSPTTLPVSAPRNAPHPTATDFGPIGSPPAASFLQRARSPNGINGITMASSPSRHGLPGTPGNTGFLSSSPFSAPGTKSNFMSYTESGMRAGMAGIAASLGPGLVIGGNERRGWMSGTPGSEMGVGGGGGGGGGGLGGGLGGIGNHSLTHTHMQNLSSSVHGPSTTMGGRAARSHQHHNFGGGEVFPFEEDDFHSGGRHKSGAIEEEIGIGIESDDDDGDDGDNAVAEGDLEDFIPGSLTDLLTPEERSRRMSRSNSSQAPGAAAAGITAGAGAAVGAGVNNAGLPGSLGHRYSRSVPAPSLLGELNKSIWSDAPGATSGLTATRVDGAHTHAIGEDEFGVMGSGIGSGAVGGGVGSIGAAGSPSFSMLSPSNASAAFLSKFHSNYSRSKQQQVGTARPLYPPGNAGVGGRTTSLLGNGAGAAMSPPPSSSLANAFRAPTNPFDLTQNPLHNPAHPNHAAVAAAFNSSNAGQAQGQGLGANATTAANTTPTTNPGNNTDSGPTSATGTGTTTTPTAASSTTTTPSTTRPIPAGLNPLDNSAHHHHHHHHGVLLSPGARALQAHAPGQSLPQGLAAGYSRIHALPPPPNPASPGLSTSFGLGVTPPTGGGLGAGLGTGAGAGAGAGVGGGLDWASSASPGAHSGLGMNGVGAGETGLDAMFSKLSYSAAAARGSGASTTTSSASSTTTIGTPTVAAANTTAGGPPGLTRNLGGMGRYQHHHGHGHGHGPGGALSPLSGPVVTRNDDDDDLFRMDK